MVSTGHTALRARPALRGRLAPPGRPVLQALPDLRVSMVLRETGGQLVLPAPRELPVLLVLKVPLGLPESERLALRVRQELLVPQVPQAHRVWTGSKATRDSLEQLVRRERLAPQGLRALRVRLGLGRLAQRAQWVLREAQVPRASMD